MFHEAEVAVHVEPEWSLYSKLTAGLAGDASLALATSETVPATFAFEAGLENVSDGGVLSTRVEPSGTPVVSHVAAWLANAPPCGAIS